MKFLLIGIISVTLGWNVFAAETKICLITTDVGPEQTQLLIETDSKGDLDTIRIYETEDNKVTSDEFYTAEQAIADGIVASERDGRQVVILRAQNFTASSGGTIALDYLYNAIKGSRKVFNLKLVKVAGKFVLLTKEGAKVNQLVFVGNRFVGQVIGIKEVLASFK